MTEQIVTIVNQTANRADAILLRISPMARASATTSD